MNRLLILFTISLGSIDDPHDTWYTHAQTTNRNMVLWTADWSADDKYMAVGGNDHALRIFEGKSFQLHKTFDLKTAVQCLDWNKNGRLLAIALDDQAVQVLNIETGEFKILKETQSGSRALAWNNTGDLLAVGDTEGIIWIYTVTGTLVKSIKKENTKSYLSVDWHPKKNVIATGSDKIRLFDVSGKELKSVKHRPEETILLSIKWHPGGSFFATGDYGHKEENIASLLQFWTEDGTLIKSLNGSKAEYRNIRWNKNGEVLATASDALRLWSKDGAILYTGTSTELLWGLDWDNNGKRIVTTSEKGKITMWSDQAKLEKQIHY